LSWAIIDSPSGRKSFGGFITPSRRESFGGFILPLVSETGGRLTQSDSLKNVQGRERE
jgi:hypothetical protein